VMPSPFRSPLAVARNPPEAPLVFDAA
jgi:hypothetical protein